jgi:hypothetical protein
MPTSYRPLRLSWSHWRATLCSWCTQADWDHLTGQTPWRVRNFSWTRRPAAWNSSSPWRTSTSLCHTKYDPLHIKNQCQCQCLCSSRARDVNRSNIQWWILRNLPLLQSYHQVPNSLTLVPQQILKPEHLLQASVGYYQQPRHPAALLGHPGHLQPLVYIKILGKSGNTKPRFKEPASQIHATL